jgi:hypothetical protein
VKGLQNLGLCSAIKAFEQGGIFIVTHLLWHGTSAFPVSSEGTTHEGMWRIYSNPDPQGGTSMETSSLPVCLFCL